MANLISCGMCLDLMPLVMDGVASEESKAAVEKHLETCGQCRAVYGNGAPDSSGERAMAKTIHRIRVTTLAVAGILTISAMILCETVIQGSSYVLGLVALGIYGLFRIAFRGGRSRFKKAVALAAAVALLWGTLWAGNELFGNPVTRALAESHIQGYLEGTFGDSDYYIEKVLYNWSGSYEGYIRSRTDPELEFYVSYRDGEILYDTYEEHVLDIWE